MRIIDTHTHLYLEQFDNDRDDMFYRAMSQGIDTFLLPNIDQESVQQMLEVCRLYPTNCFPMIGLHPTSVKEDYVRQLDLLFSYIDKTKPIAIGEIGIDLYWDQSFKDVQIDAFRAQIGWAKSLNLPVSVHTREANAQMIEIVESEQDGRLKGVFHCFSGTAKEADQMTDLGFYLGLGGVLTYKNSSLSDSIKDIPLSYILLETDAPFLAPVPYRGKRNESVYLLEVVKKLSEIYQTSVEEIASTTTNNAKKLFKLP